MKSGPKVTSTRESGHRALEGHGDQDQHPAMPLGSSPDHELAADGRADDVTSRGPNAWVRNAAVFSKAGHNHFAIDRVELLLSPALPRWHTRRWSLTDEGRAMRSKGVTRLGGCLAVQLPSKEDVTVQQFLGRDGRSDGSVACLYKTNVMRRLRRRLTESSQHRREDRAFGARSDNYIAPTRLPPGSDIHVEAIKELVTIIAEAKEQYTANIANVFGDALPPDKVHVTISKIELTWDVPTTLARGAATIWWPVWRDGFVGSGRGLGLDDSDPVRLRRTAATERREVDAMGGSGVLRADGPKGGGVKLYPKHERLLRFEAEFTSERARTVLGHPVRLDKIRLARDLGRLAVGPYNALLAAQDNLLCTKVLSLTKLIGAFHPSKGWDKLRPIIEALEGGEVFHNPGERYSDVLAALRKKGLVKYLGGGDWGPTGPLQFTLRRLVLARTRSGGPA